MQLDKRDRALVERVRGITPGSYIPAAFDKDNLCQLLNEIIKAAREEGARSVGGVEVGPDGWHVLTDAGRALLGGVVAEQGPWAGCHVDGVGIVLPTRESFPYMADCWEANRRHEIAHAWDWPQTHPGARLFTCNPKD